MKRIRKNIKTSISFFQKRATECCIHVLLCFYKNEKNNFFSQTKEIFKIERYLNLYNFNNRNTINKIMFSSHNLAINILSCHNLAINTTKWYNLQENMEICKKCERKEIENEIPMTFSRDKFDYIRRKAFNSINEVDNIKLQIGNKILGN